MLKKLMQDFMKKIHAAIEPAAMIKESYAES